jgi:hypothetical protein
MEYALKALIIPPEVVKEGLCKHCKNKKEHLLSRHAADKAWLKTVMG